MSISLHILGIRHHGPGSARMVLRALQDLKPDAILIEGPPDAADLIEMASDKEMHPPVALLVYEPDSPQTASYFPFAEFSPEWQAIRFGLKSRADVRFIDLPRSMRPSGAKPKTADQQPPQRIDALEQLAHAAGYTDGEAWWSRLIEERRGEEEPMAVFDAIRDAMSSLREKFAAPEFQSSRDLEEVPREAHMRRSIRAAIKEGVNRIAVVCGAWHAPVLTQEFLDKTPAKEDDAALKGLEKRKTAATWIPWTHGRLAFDSGYGAGVTSPGWYEHLWVHHDRIAERWLTSVARLMREEDLEGSPANVIESVRLSESLAMLRGRAAPGLEEFTEATLSVLCAGNPLPLKVIERKLIVGEKLGTVPSKAPAVPLQRDLEATQKSLRLKVSADDLLLELDLRKENDLARSRLFHRLALLEIPWAESQADSTRNKGTFRETWKLQWKPELSICVIEAARFGNTIESAASARVAFEAANAKSLPPLTSMLDHAMLADLSQAVASLLQAIESVSAVSADIGNLMEAIPPLAGVLRYGNVRKTDAELVTPIVRSLLVRVCAGLVPACTSLDDDAASKMLDRINHIDASLGTLEEPEFSDMWFDRVLALGDSQTHGLVNGRCWRLLFDARKQDPATIGDRVALALSPGNDPEKSSAWLEGFLSGSGLVLIHDARLLALVDAWVCSLPPDVFERTCPIGRRTFGSFAAPERRQIGEKLKKSGAPTSGPSGARSHAHESDYDAARGELVLPILRQIFGDIQR
ncbi:MAG: hypothetical protein JNK16_08760 [Phycisphaerales bacterium]|nr:hypothetical protein [Phycisphaerales bacterium]